MPEMSDDYGRKVVEADSTVGDAAAHPRPRRNPPRGLIITALLVLAGVAWAAPAEREARVSVGLASVRAQPSTTAQVLFRAPRGTVFRVVDQQGDWYLVAAPSRQPGYVHRSVVEVRDQSSAEASAAQPSAASAPPAPAGPKIDHAPLECLPANDFPLVDASVTSSAELYRARVFFKAHQYPDWYYIEMKATSLPQYLALLPQPLPGTEQVDYYLEALDTGLQTVKTTEYGPVVSRTGCMARDIGGLPDSARREITIRGTKEGQPPIPPGFNKKGIIAFVAVAGTAIAGAALSTGGAATAAAGGAAAAGTAGAGGATTTAAAAGTASAGTGGGISTATLAIVGGGVAAAGVGVAVATKGGSKDSTPNCPSATEIAATSGGAIVAVGSDTICTAWVPCPRNNIRSCVSHFCSASGCTVYYEFNGGSQVMCGTNCGSGDYTAINSCAQRAASVCIN